MKITNSNRMISTICAVAALWTVTAAAQPADTPANYQDAIKKARASESKRAFTQAITEAEAAAKLAENPAQRFETDMIRLRASVQEKKLEEATKILSQINSADYNAQQRANAIIYLANHYLNTRKYEDARNYYQQLTLLPEATPEIKLNGVLGVADSYWRDGDFKTARTELEKAFALENLSQDLLFRAVERKGTYFAQVRDHDLALDYLIKEVDLGKFTNAQRIRLMNHAATYATSLENHEQARKLLRDCLKLENITDSERGMALEFLIGLESNQQKFNEVKTLIEKELLPLEKLPTYVYTNPMFACARLAYRHQKYDDAIWFFEKAFQIQGEKVAKSASDLFQLAECLFFKGKKDAAIALWKEALGNQKYPADQRLRAAYLLAAANGASTRTACADLEKETGTSFQSEIKAKFLLDAARVFYKVHQESVVRTLLAERETCLVPAARKEITTKFVPRAPASANAWAESPYIKDQKNAEKRFAPYGDAGTLWTDAANQRQFTENAAQGQKEGYETRFYTLADARGWHLFVECVMPNADDVEYGVAGGGALELFLRPGDGESYFQWIVDYPSGKTNYYDWDTVSESYRVMKNYIKTDVARTEHGLGVYTFVPWALVYDKLPETGKDWNFSLCNWSPGGSISWGGKVHEASKWGDVKWADLSPAVTADMKKRILFASVAPYKAAKTEAVMHYNREYHGDIGFYQTVLKPYFEKMDAVVAKIKKDMTGEEVNQIFTDHIKDLRETPLKVQNFRQRYLLDQLTSPDKN